MAGSYDALCLHSGISMSTTSLLSAISTQIDPFGHSSVSPQVFADAGFEMLVINRISVMQKVMVDFAPVLHTFCLFIWSLYIGGQFRRKIHASSRMWRHKAWLHCNRCASSCRRQYCNRTHRQSDVVNSATGKNTQEHRSIR